MIFAILTLLLFGTAGLCMVMTHGRFRQNTFHFWFFNILGFICIVLGFACAFRI